MEVQKSQPIGAMLRAAGLVTAGQLNEALELQKKQGGKTVENLIALGYLNARDFTKFISRQAGVGGMDISQYEVREDLIDLLPREIVLEHEVFPIDRMGSLLTIGMVFPLDTATISKLEDMTGLRIKPLLVSKDDLRQSINRYYKHDEDESQEAEEMWSGVLGGPASIEAPLRLSSVAALVRKLDSFPALPGTVRQVREAMEDIEVSTHEVAEIIKHDPPIAAKVLSVANSPAYGFPSRVSTLELAVALLGLREVYSIVLSAAVLDVFNASASFDYKAFWLKSMLRGSLAVVVARLAGQEKRSGIFATGLILDIGQLALATVIPDRYASLMTKAHNGTLLAAEEQQIGITHSEAGYILAEEWELPQDMAEAIRLHHSPNLAEKAPALTAIAGIAEWLAAASADELKATHLLESQSDAFLILELGEGLAENLINETRELLQSRFLLEKKWERSLPSS